MWCGIENSLLLIPLCMHLLLFFLFIIIFHRTCLILSIHANGYNRLSCPYTKVEGREIFISVHRHDNFYSQYSRTSMAGTPLEPRKYVGDSDSSSE